MGGCAWVSEEEVSKLLFVQEERGSHSVVSAPRRSHLCDGTTVVAIAARTAAQLRTSRCILKIVSSNALQSEAALSVRAGGRPRRAMFSG